MAEIFRIIRYVDPATGQRCKKGTPGAVAKRAKKYTIRYYNPAGERLKAKGYADKKATETLAGELERRAERIAAGRVDPADVHGKRPLAEHSEDFRRYLAAKGNTPDYVGKMLFRLTAVLDGCRFIKIGDVQSSAVVEYLGALRKEGKSVKTANDYLAAVKGFTRWLWRDKRSVLDALAGLSKLANEETDQRHARRDLAPDELGRLFDAARQSDKVIRFLPGIDRHFLYLTAAATGFRVSELASMTRESFRLDGDAPTATVQAACTKNRKEAVQPLPLDVAAALRPWLATKPAGEPLWPDNPMAPAESWRRHAAEMIRRDLKDARATWLQSIQDARQQAEAEQSDYLAYCDAEGRYADFHALRHSFITMVGKAGVSPREHQDLARHSTYALTSRYSHSRFYDLCAAVQALPIPTAGPATGAPALAATGTEGRAEKSGLQSGLQTAKTADFGGQRRTEKQQPAGNEKPGKTKHYADSSGFSEASDIPVSHYPQGDSNPCLSRERAMS